MAIWLSLDPAIGGGNALLATQPTDTHLHVIDLRYDFGLQRVEDILERLEQFAAVYRPTLCIIEYDSMQKAIGKDDRTVQMAHRYGFQIVPHISRGQKNRDVTYSVASMNQSFVRKEITIPWADDPQTRSRIEPLVMQLRAWRPDLPSTKLQQDTVMALWFAWRRWMIQRYGERHNPSARKPKRPSWLR